ncbi:hypothetical protein QN277_004214 [Acacia crassicarpa]|uniref:Uncharacterized protein n=1 Tax=Acacia crassicarpa TaxID=499986 RepID=A0AAE1IZV9_9FABA|nr:hypothetical protein QN277_004214 [Acacia crassicarpa]
MNFLARSATSVSAERPSVPKYHTDPRQTTSSTSTLETLISEDSFKHSSITEEYNREIDGAEGEDGTMTTMNSIDDFPGVAKHSDVSDEEGWITIPYKELPENWNQLPDIQSLRSLDRSFLFPGEQVHIVACLSACNLDTEIITPFKVAAVMSKNGLGLSPEKENGDIENRNKLVSGLGELSPNGHDHPTDVSAGESLLRMEDHRRQTALLLQKFENSHFFVRIAESDEPLWSKKGSSEAKGQMALTVGTKESAENVSTVCAVIDRGNFDANMSGGLARSSVKCCALPNGDILVLLQVNVGVDFLRDPCIEILQFEKHQEKNLSSRNQGNSLNTNQDPCGELLKWLLPLDNTLPPPTPALSPPHLTNNSGIGSTSQRSNFSSPSGSQLFSFSNFRSYSMSSLPQNTNPSPPPIKVPSPTPSSDHEDLDLVSSQKLLRKKPAVEDLLSFRGVSLDQERFSVCCGLQGIYTPGKRWRRKIEIIQPVEIHSFAANCNSEDLLCVQIKNVAPAHASDIVVFIDAITIVFEEASKSGPPASLPIACIEAGNDHFLPNLALRRGEEHSFILKPATSMWKDLKVLGERSSQLSKLQFGNYASNSGLSSKSADRRKIASTDDQYAIMVSCRCNYTASRLFFKQPTNWRPRTSRDVLISVASDMSGQSPGPDGRNSQLHVQVLTLRASNLTSEDLTMTVLAPASFTSPPSVVSLSSPDTPMSPFIGFAECVGRINGERHAGAIQGLTSIIKENHRQSNDGPRTISIGDDVIPRSGLSCTHLWLQSRVPLGCVPSQSTATIKLELLPLTDGIITLDTLQIDIKEKGVTYIPECSLKINATSSISTGII